MTPPPLAQVDAHFEALLALPESERGPRLEQIAAGDPALARSLRRLLQLMFDSDTRPLRALGAAALDDGDDDATPQIPGYRIERELGRGGMGAVYEAARDLGGGIWQPVAVKVLRRALLRDEDLTRFVTEQRILARLRHPHIAGLLDAGVAGGRPWMALERVAGAPIDQCLPLPAAPAAVLGAMLQVAEALQQAHALLVVHRDIKPDNVLMDADGGVTLIDFGIAKQLDAGLEAGPTATGAAPLTLRYASPEQLLQRPVGVASDLYQIGLLMYRLLTDAWPWPESAQQLPVLRTRADGEPPPPSRQVPAGPRRRALAGDIDAIVLRCLRFDPAQRYRSASELHDDLRRCLRGEPVRAAAGGARYRFGKFARRHRVAVGSASAAMLAILVGLAAFAWQAHVAGLQRDRAVAAEGEARQRAQELEQMVAFQASQLADLPVRSMGIDLRRDLLDQRRERLARDGGDPPAVEAGVAALETALQGLNFTGVALHALERHVFERAQQAIGQQFGDQPLLRARLLLTLGNTLRGLGLHERAGVALEEALAIRRALLGASHRDTLAAGSNLGLLRVAQGRHDEAEALYQAAADGLRAELGDDHEDSIRLTHNLGTLRQAQGRFAEAQVLLEEALAARRARLGASHVDTLGTMNALGSVHWQQARYDAAEAIWREAEQGYLERLGELHVDTLAVMNNRGLALMSLDRQPESEQLQRRTLELRRQLLGDEHPQTLSSANNLAVLLSRMEQREQAAQLYAEVLATRSRVLGPEHHDTAGAQMNLGMALRGQGRLDEAEPYYLASLAGYRRALGPEHPNSMAAIGNLANLRREQGRMDEAERLAREALELRRRVRGADHPETLSSLHMLALVLRDTGRHAEAEDHARQALDAHRARHGDTHRATRQANELLLSILDARHAAEPGGGHGERAAQLRQEIAAQQ